MARITESLAQMTIAKRPRTMTPGHDTMLREWAKKTPHVIEFLRELDAECIISNELAAALDNAIRLLEEVWRDNPNHPIWTNGRAALARWEGK